MSGIAGIFNRDGRPVEPELLTRMTDCIAHRGPDGVNHWLAGPVGLGHCMLWTTPEAVNEQQPLLDETGQLCLVLDGRVDNREELITALEAKGFRLRTDTDAEIVPRAYQCWGEACPEKIIGDFAFVIWDGCQQQLFCARDFLGIKPFYYFVDSKIFIFGSELHQLFEDSSIPREPNEDMIGEYLLDIIFDEEETLYKNIFRLPPAHYLIINKDIRKQKYFPYDPPQEIQYHTDQDYAEHFLQIFREAIRCRLRSYGRVGAELSGGVDSSSIVGGVKSLINDGGNINLDFETFSLIFPGLSCDESSYIQDVIQFWNITSNLIIPEPPEATCFIDQTSRYYDFPDYPTTSMYYPLMKLARDKGFKIMLSGSGGDDWLTGSLHHYADLLSKLRVFSLCREIYCDYRADVLTDPIAALLYSGVRPLLSTEIRSQLGRIRRMFLRRDRLLIPTPLFNLSKATEAMHRSEKVQQKFLSFAQKDMYKMLTRSQRAHSLEMIDRTVARFGLERRYPFHDRRLVEFVLSLPEEQRRRSGVTKVILRQAAKDLLPETILQRLSKADGSSIYIKVLQSIGGDLLFEDLSIASKGWISGEQTRAAYQHMTNLYNQDDDKYMDYTWRLWMIFGIETWFNNVFLNNGIICKANSYPSKD